MIKEIQTASPEKWRDIPGFEGLYIVSDQGNVRSLPRNTTKGRIISQEINWDYCNVTLYKDGKRKYCKVQRLVAQAFPDICGEWFEGCQVNHLNECKWDNRAINLRTCTAKENIRWATGIERSAIGHSKPIGCRKNGTLIWIFANAQIVKNYIKGANYKNISACCHGKRKSHCGYEWFFI